VLGLDIENQSKILAEETLVVPNDIKILTERRETARKAKDFETADETRAEIEKKGYEISDTNSGPTVRKRFIS